jgi:Bax protein
MLIHVKEYGVYNQRRIIKSLLIVTGAQLTIFTSYYIYNNIIKESIKKSITPQKVTEREDITPPTSKRLDKPTEQVINEKPKESIILTKKLRRIAPNNTEDIIQINSKRVTPVLYTNSISLSSLSVPQKKQKFIDMMIPSILVAKHQMRLDKERVASLIIKHDISLEDEKWLADKRKEFHALDNYELHDKMESHPRSIVIAQAIVESGWGTSKFFQKANNVFGVWSFSKRDNRIAASKKRGEKTIYLKKYKSMEESVYDYFVTLARKDCYRLFQKKKLITQDPYKLVNYLIKYSERGESYTKELKAMIRQNKLSAYDGYQLDL